MTLTAIHSAPDPVDLHVGAKMRLRRKQLGLTQNALADALGITFQQVQKYEKGSNRVSASMLWRAARFLDVEPGWFFEGLAADSDRSSPPDPLLGFGVMAGGLELAAVYTAMPAEERRALLTVAVALADRGRVSEAA
jgi:transcriptional regulator with XRE-family HTH domain